MSTTGTPFMEPNEFSADASILGFKYQIRYALLLFLQAQRTHGADVSLAIEQIDDIDLFAAGSITSLVQTKNTTAVLTDCSAPLWKTVRIWSEAILKEIVRPDGGIRFRLITTGASPSDDAAIVNLLIKKDSEAALEQMRLLAAAKQQLATLGKAYQAFCNLQPEQQQQLVERIDIETSAPNFDNLDASIRDLIVHGPPGKRDAFADVLFARWDRLVESHLRAFPKQTIHWQTLQELLHDISLQFNDDSLPLEFDGMLRDAFPALSDDNRTFMRQLVAVAAPEPIRRKAQVLCLRSTQLVGFWLRKVNVPPDVIDAHALVLARECESKHEAVPLERSLVGATPEEIGQHILKWAIDIAPYLELMRVRPRCTDADVIRGRFHELANLPALGWHPNWRAIFSSEGA